MFHLNTCGARVQKERRGEFPSDLHVYMKKSIFFFVFVFISVHKLHNLKKIIAIFIANLKPLENSLCQGLLLRSRPSKISIARIKKMALGTRLGVT